MQSSDLVMHREDIWDILPACATAGWLQGLTLMAQQFPLS